MKPSKKQNNKKGNVNEIKSFFKAAPKSFVVDKTNVSVQPKNGDKQFYVDLLKNKLEALESFPEDEALAKENESCKETGVEQTETNRNVETKTPSSEVSNLKKSRECTGCIEKTVERDELERKYKQEVEQRKELKKVYMNLNIEFSELYIKYQSLLKAKGVDREILHGETSGNAAKHNEPTSSGASGTAAKDNEAIAGGVKDDTYTEMQLKFLQFMPLDKKSDCTFILQCLKYAYQNDSTVLASRTLKGTAERTEITNEGIKIHHERKAPLTPEKVDRIKSLFMERISKCQTHSADFVERIKDPYVNKLFAAGIGNLSKKNKLMTE